MAIFKAHRTIPVSQTAFKTHSSLDVVETPPVRRVSRCSSAGWPQGAKSAAAWKTGGGARRRSLSGQALGSRLLVPGSGFAAPGALCGAILQTTRSRGLWVRTEEAVSSDPPAVRSPTELRGRWDGAAAPHRSPAPCCIRLREGGGEAEQGRAGGGECGELRNAVEGLGGCGAQRPSRTGEWGRRGTRCLGQWGERAEGWEPLSNPHRATPPWPRIWRRPLTSACILSRVWR